MTNNHGSCVAFENISRALHFAKRRGFRWVVMNKSGELWAGCSRPEYHQSLPMWIWVGDEESWPKKIGYIYPSGDWKLCRWRAR